MTVEEIIRAASEVSPEKMEKVATALFYLEHVDPSFVDELREEIREISTYSMEKSAAVNIDPNSAKSIAKTVAVGAGTMAAAGLIAATATDLYDAAKRGLTRGRNFKRIMDANPDFSRTKEEREKALAAFNAVHRYSPEMTADPMVGGALIYNIMNGPRSAHTIIKDTIGMRAGLQGSLHKQVGFMLTNQDLSGYRKGGKSQPAVGAGAGQQPGGAAGDVS